MSFSLKFSRNSFYLLPVEQQHVILESGFDIYFGDEFVELFMDNKKECIDFAEDILAWIREIFYDK